LLIAVTVPDLGPAWNLLLTVGEHINNENFVKQILK